MSATTVTAFDAFAPVPEMSVLELAVLLCFARKPGSTIADVAEEIGHWFKASVVESDLSATVRRLVHREWVTTDGITLHATDEALQKAEFAAKGLVKLIYRDRYFFNVGKLLDVTILREDQSNA
ncbi:MAG: hypothetical protein K2Y71_25680 [Xanthobacteraceae bacterium]|nr:hypothetical protein [Xanthobacteraceae bacterium]